MQKHAKLQGASINKEDLIFDESQQNENEKSNDQIDKNKESEESKGSDMTSDINVGEQSIDSSIE